MPRTPFRYPFPLIVLLVLLAVLPISKLLLMPSLARLGATAIELAATFLVIKRWRLVTYIIAVLYIGTALSNITTKISTGSFVFFFDAIFNGIYLVSGLYYFSPQMTKFLKGHSNET